MSSIGWWFNGWEPILRILVVGSAAYFTLVFLLRATNKRTLAQLNAFDFIITVAIGASFGRILTARQVAFTEAFTAFALLILLQYAMTRLQLRSQRVAKALTAPPTLLYYQGQYLEGAMEKQRVTASELESAVRRKGAGSLELVEAVILESNGKFSVIKKPTAGDGSLVNEKIEK